MSSRVADVATERLAPRKLWWAGPLAAVVAAIVNSALFVGAQSAGLITDAVLLESPTGPQPMNVAAVIMFSVGGLLVGAALLALLTRLSSRPLRVFRIVGIVFLVAYAIAPFTIPGAPIGYILALEVLHLVAGGIALLWLPRLLRA
jgi:hypothetical protein